MKKMILLLAVFAFIGTTVNAQCTGKSSSTAIKTSDTKLASEKKSCAATCAAKLAAKDASVEKKVCEKSGKVSYARKSVCEKSGKVSYTAVNYDPATKAFVNSSSASAIQVASSGKKTCSASAAAKLAAQDVSIQKRVCEKSGKVSYARKTTCEKSGKVSYTDVKYCSDSKAFVNAAPASATLVSSEKKSCAATCAAKLAARDTSIEKKVCSTSGKVSYARKSVCEKSGKVSYTAVNYDPATKAFVNSSSASAIQVASSGKKTCSASAAAKLAAQDTSIEKKVCSTSGKVSYAKKSVCPASGKVSYTDVKYCADSQKFVNVAPEGAESKAKLVNSKTSAAKKACCSGKDAKKCCAKKGSKK